MKLDTENIKLQLRNYYNQEAGYRDSGEKQDWKINQRSLFCERIRSEKMKTLLELGAGTGYDSRYFMDCGLDVTAIDLSGEMVRLCRDKGINAYEMDIYNVTELKIKFDCIWSMNSLLHIPKAELRNVLSSIDSVLNPNGLFYMGVYGGEDSEKLLVNDISITPRFFAGYSKSKLEEILCEYFNIIDFVQFDVGGSIDFQSITMKKRELH